MQDSQQGQLVAVTTHQAQGSRVLPGQPLPHLPLSSPHLTPSGSVLDWTLLPDAVKTTGPFFADPTLKLFDFREQIPKGSAHLHSPRPCTAHDTHYHK